VRSEKGRLMRAGFESEKGRLKSSLKVKSENRRLMRAGSQREE
jgi:hypothetical protein